MAVVKLCGIKSEEDAALMNEVKPDYVGFVFAPGKHQISAAPPAGFQISSDTADLSVFL